MVSSSACLFSVPHAVLQTHFLLFSPRQRRRSTGESPLPENLHRIKQTTAPSTCSSLEWTIRLFLFGIESHFQLFYLHLQELRSPWNLLRGYFSWQLVDLLILLPESTGLDQMTFGPSSLLTSCAFSWSLAEDSTYGKYLLAVRQHYWLSDSRVWLLIRATNGKGSSRNWLVTQGWWMEQGNNTGRLPTTYWLPPTFIMKGRVTKNRPEGPHCAPHCVFPAGGQPRGLCSSRSPVSQGGCFTQHGTEFLLTGGSPMLPPPGLLSFQGSQFYTLFEAVQCCTLLPMSLRDPAMFPSVPWPESF